MNLDNEKKLTKNKNKLIIIAGATACGKTETAIALAKKVGGEIISADSMQIYKYMDIGTAKPTRDEMQGIKHYLIDELLPDDEYSAASFQKMAKSYLNDIYERGHVPIIAGGTGFYINALLYDNDFTETKTDKAYRESLYKLAEIKGSRVLYEKLLSVDPESANYIHENNVKRVVRALEYYEQTGERISMHNERERHRKPAYDTCFFILSRERQKLYAHIEKRVDIMIQKGLVSEVSRLLEMGYHSGLVSMQGLGYKEIVRYIEGQLSLSKAIEELKKGTRHFAKRQLTWFNHQCHGVWLNVDNCNILAIAEEIYAQINTQRLEE